MKVSPMRPVTVVVVCASVCAALAVHAQQPQEPDPAVQGQEPFRAGVDVIQLDVSVLDSDGHPVAGLTAADFTVRENGRPQQIVSVSYVEAAAVDPVRSARMRFVTPDVAINNLADRAGDSRLFAIVLDDMNIPPDDSEIVISARETARYIVEQMNPSDQAAVVYVNDAGKTQDFTNDQRKLLDAIDKFVPDPPDFITATPRGTGQGGGDMPYRYSSALARTPCLRDQPGVPALDAVTTALASVPGRRKTLIFLSIGIPVTFGSRASCGSVLDGIMKEVFRKAQRANINIHTIDPAGYNGYRDYLELRRARGRALVRREPPSNIRQLKDFLKTVAENTGGQVVVDTDAILPGVDRIFREYSAYYLLGYESSDGRPDGRFREIDVRVDRPDVTIRARSGYWAPEPGDVVARERAAGRTDFSPEDSGLTGAPGVPLRAAAMAIGPSATGDRVMDVAVALSVRWPPLRASVRETLTLIRHVYDADGRAGEPEREIVEIDLAPGDESHHEIVRHLTLEPGRYEVRFNATSAILDRSGSIYANLEVPDFTRSALSLSGIVLGAAGPATSGPSNLPVVPTSNRDFTNGEDVTTFVRVYQGGTADLAPAVVAIEILDVSDRTRFEAAKTLAPEAFDVSRGAAYQFSLPLDRLEPGPHLLSVTARLANGRTARRDVIFRVR
jgi:VWFA-related protein